MNKWFGLLGGKSVDVRNAKNGKNRSLRLESLEDRQMLDAMGLVDASAVVPSEAAIVSQFESGIIAVTLTDDVVDDSDDFNVDGSFGSISLREAATNYVGMYFYVNDFHNDQAAWADVQDYLSDEPSDGAVLIDTISIAVDSVELGNQVVVSYDCAIEGNSATVVANDSRALYLSATVTIKDLNFEGGNGSISEKDPSWTRSEYNAIKKAEGKGGAVYVDGNANVTLYNVNFASAGLDSVNGGAIYNKGVLKIDGAELSDNTANYGGAIYNAGSLTVNSARFTSNVAYLGGAVYNAAGATAKFNGERGDYLADSTIVFEENVAKFKNAQTLSCGSGAAIYNSANADADGVVVLYNVDINFNEAAKYGGAIANYGSLTANGAFIGANEAVTGGAVANAGSATFVDCNISGNHASANGGAIFSSNNATSGADGSLTLKGSNRFADNVAVNGGGAIDVVSGSVSFFGYSATIFTGNKAEKGAGAAVLTDTNQVYFLDSPSFEFSDNTSSMGLIASSVKLVDAKPLVEGFGFDYSELTSDQYYSFSHYATDIADNKFSFDYLANMSSTNSPYETIYVNYNGNVVALAAGSEVTFEELGIPTTTGTYKVTFYFDNDLENAYELIVGISANSNMSIRRVEFNPETGLSAFSFASYGKVVKSWNIAWGDGAASKSTDASLIYTTSHLYPTDLSEAEITLRVQFADKTQETFKFKYNVGGSSLDWVVDGDELLDAAFAELDLEL